MIEPSVELVLCRIFDAPRALVFSCWAEPERLARWWGPQGFTSKVQRWDTRAGGEHHVDMIAPDGAVHFMRGRFEEFAPPERLVMVSGVLDPAGQTLFEVRTEVEFAEQAGQTILTMRARPFNTTADAAPYLAGMEVGWTETLDRLAAEACPEAAAREITASRYVAAPPRRVWQAWTTPEIVRWWGPDGFTTTIQDMAVRPGGDWRFTMHGPDATDYPNHNIYGELLAPHRLAYTHASPPVHEVTVLFTPQEQGTRVSVRMLFATESARAATIERYHADEGLRQTLARLGALFSPKEAQ